jgi:transcriptional regulator with XRE-family HTH domain
MRREAETFDIELGRRLRLVRLTKGLSQQFVGEYLGVSFQQIQKYERGTDRLSVASLVRLQDVYEVPLDALVPGSSRTFPVPTLGRRAAKLVRDFEAIRCEKVRTYLAALIRSVAAGQSVELDQTRRVVPSNPTGMP